MALKVLPMEEGDFIEFARIQTAAFNAAGGMVRAMSPSPLPPDYLEKSASKHKKSWREEPDVTYLKVVDTNLNNKIVAGAKWRINEKERTEEQIKIQLPVPGKDEEGRPAAQHFMNYLSRVRKEYMGTKPFYCMSIKYSKDIQSHLSNSHSLTPSCDRSGAPQARSWSNAA